MEEEKEPQIIEYYLTDLDGNKIQEIEAGKCVILNIHSKNMISKLFTIDLSNKTVDFKYNGKILNNDTIKDYKINKNIEKLELEVIEQE